MSTSSSPVDSKVPPLSVLNVLYGYALSIGTQSMMKKPHALLDEGDIQLFASGKYVLVCHTACWTRNVSHSASRRSIHIVRKWELDPS